MNRIEKLTDAQIARFPEWVEKWVAVGLSTEPADFESAERGIRGCYTSAKLPQPKLILRFSSPYAVVVGGAAAVSLLGNKQVWSQVWSQVESQVRSQVRSQVESQVRSQVWSQVRSQVRSQVWSQVWSQVESQVESQVWSQVESQVRSQVWSQVESQVRSQVWSQVESAWSQYRGGSLWAGWYAYVSFLRDVCGWANASLADFAHDELHALSAGWCWYHDDVAAISDRPLRLLFNDRGQLHGEDAAAIEWRDGYSLWAINGVVIDEQIVMRPQSQTIEQIRGEQNEEIKRIRIDRFGWDRYLTGINATRIDRRRNDIEGTREALYRADGHSVLVCVCPSTAKVFSLEVPPATETCEQAQRYLSSGLSSRIISAS
jgi:hypothetical protein